MNKRRLKKHLFKGNCPVCLHDRDVKWLRLRNNDMKYFPHQWLVTECGCGYKENKRK